MAKSLKDILAGVKSSKIVPGSTGSDPGVDYAPKAPNEQEFVKKHTREKHADRVGNGDDVYQATNVKHSQVAEPKHGYKKPEDKNVNEGKEEAKCNMTAEGTYCAVHEMADCSKQKSLKEVLTKKTPAGEVIRDFQKSDNPKFAGKSQEKRKQMALAAYYAKQRNEEVELDEDTMSVKDANKLQDKHASAAQHARKAGDKKAYDAHMQHAASIEDKVIQSKSGSTIAGKSLKAKSEKLFKDHPYGIKEEVEEATDPLKARERLTRHITKDEKSKEIAHKHLKSMIKATKGTHPKPNLPEEAEQIDEISKKTVASYSAKAGKEVKGNQPSDPDKLRKRTNREQGMKLAYKKYNGFKSVPATEETEGFNSGAEHGTGSAEQIDEVSRPLLQRYLDTAKKKPAHWADPPKKFEKREKGHALAHKKLGNISGGARVMATKEAVKEDLAVPLVGGDDESAEMAKTQLRALANKALHLAMQLNDDQIVEPWVQAKIAVAKDHVTAVHDYMVYGDHSKDKEEDEQTAPSDGGIDMSGSPRNTFPNFSVDVNTGRNV